MTHDPNCNPTTYNNTSLTFDPENRLTAYGTSLTAGYRGDGLRAWKQTVTGRTYFIYDGTTPVVELDATGAVTATHTFGAAGLVSRRAGGASVFYTFDPQGNVSERLDAAGGTLSTYAFTAHGGAVTPLTSSDPYGYKARFGYYTDHETGLLLLTHRYYDPQAGRFLTRDPISYQGGINLYGYTKNNLVNWADPKGLDDSDYPITGSPSPNPWYWSHNESADNESFGPRSTGENPFGYIWLQGEAEAAAHLTVLGGTGSGGVIINAQTGEYCTYLKACSRLGYGVFAGVGLEGGASIFGPRCGKDTGGLLIEGTGELATPAGGGSIAVGYGGGLGLDTSVGPDIGIGFSLGLDICGVKVMKCYNSPPDCGSSCP